jgi:hypothetical protein
LILLPAVSERPIRFRLPVEPKLENAPKSGIILSCSGISKNSWRC